MRRPATWKNRFLMATLVGTLAFWVAASSRRFDADTMALAYHTSFAITATAALMLQALTEAALILPGERSTGSLPVLLTIPRTTRSIATGLLAARWIQSAYSMMLLFPLGCIPLLLGGMNVSTLMIATAAAILGILQAAAFGLIGGGGCRDARTALMRAGSLALFWWVMLPGLLGILITVMQLPVGIGRQPWASAEVIKFMEGIVSGVLQLGPFLAVQSGLSPDGGGPPGGVPPLWTALLGAVLATGVAILVTARRLSREEESLLVGQRSRGGPALTGGGIPILRQGVPGARPLVWREGRLREGSTTFLKRWIPRLTWGLYLGAYVFFAWGLPIPKDDLHLPPDVYLYDTFLAVPIWASLLFTLSSTGTFLAEEKERNTFDPLRVTPIPAVQYLCARFEAYLWRVRYHAGALAVLWVASVVTGRSHILALPLVVIGVLPVLPAVLAASMWLGHRAETAKLAARRVGSLFFGMIFLTPILVGTVGGLMGSSDALLLVAFSPPYSAIGPFLLLMDANDFSTTATIAAFLWIIPGVIMWKMLLRAIRIEYQLA
jgi:hypothetical protein